MSSVSGTSTTGSANTHTSQPKHKQAVPRNALTVPTIAPPNANYSHSTAVAAGKATVYLCGMMGDLPGDGRIISGGVAGQMTQIMRNVKAILEASGSSLGKIVQRRIYLVDMGDLRVVDRIWGEWVKEPWPVSTCVQVVRLAKVDAKVEIEVVAEAN